MKQQIKFKETEIGEIPEDWEVRKLGDLVIHKKGFAFKSSWYQNSGKRIIKVSDFTTRSIDLSKTVFIDSKKAEEFLSFELKTGDLVIATVGSWPNNPASIVGKVIKVPKKANNSLLNQNSVRLRTKSNEIMNQGFLFYRLKTKDFSDYLIAGAQGSANQASITLNDIFTFELALPPIKEQKLISKIFEDLDSKIELLQEQNKVMEDLGQIIFKHWFIDFEFPNEQGKSYKSSGGKMTDSELGKIPKRWKVDKLGEYVESVSGCSYTSKGLEESNNALVTLKSVGVNGFIQEGFKEYTGDYKEKHIVKDGDIVVAHTDLTQNRVILGKPAIVRDLGKYEIMIASMDLSIVRSLKLLNKPYIFYLLSTNMFHSHAQAYANGTTVIHLSRKAIPEFSFVVPTENILKNFKLLSEPLFNKISNNQKEILSLQKMRDLLLPKLMSGKIRVPIEVKHE